MTTRREIRTICHRDAATRERGPFVDLLNPPPRFVLVPQSTEWDEIGERRPCHNMVAVALRRNEIAQRLGVREEE